MIEWNECGCPYEENMEYYPECGNPTTIKFVNKTGLTNCPNCGAPVTNNIACEYCESAFPQEKSEQVIINNTTINKEAPQSGNSGIGVGAAAFLGGMLGSFLDD